MSIIRLRAVLLAGAAALSVLPVLSAGAAAAASDVATSDLAVTASQQKAVLGYWTPERIKALTQPSSNNPPKAAADGAPWTGPGATFGRLFFTDHGVDASCTATVVRSANRSTVVTAGHCVENTDLLGGNHAWNANSLFIPGYHDGQAPYGKFVGRLGVADRTWLANDQQNAAKFDTYDQAFVALNPNDAGKHVEDAVGAAQNIGFDAPGGADVYQFGYPRAASDPARQGLPEYIGERLAFCHGPAKHYTGTTDHPDSPDEWGTACVMGGGSSGGPRLRGFNPDTAVGTVIGDNTHAGFFDATGKACPPGATANCTRYLVGPQFSTAVTKPLYERAQSAH